MRVFLRWGRKKESGLGASWQAVPTPKPLKSAVNRWSHIAELSRTEQDSEREQTRIMAAQLLQLQGYLSIKQAVCQTEEN